MKKLNFFFILLLLLFQQTLFSQNYFGQITDVDLNRPQTTSGVEAFFGLESINTDYLDIAITQRRETGYQYRYGQWNLNNGNGTYTTYNPSYSFNVQTSGEYKANLFVKLRPSSNVKDFIVCRDNGLEVHWNQSGEIGDIYQNFTNNGNPWLFFETVFLILRIFLKIFWSVIILSISMSF